MPGTARVDKWLWATRFFKTRGSAAEMCLAGKVKRLGHPLKAASILQADDVLSIPFPAGPGIRTVRVLALIDKRLCASEARVCYEETTDPEVFEAQKHWHLARAVNPRGRPTKKDRREIGRIRGFFE